jgi:signal peptidase
VIPSVTGFLVLGLLYGEVLRVKTLFEESLRPIVLLFLAISVASDVILGFVSGFGRNPLTLTQSLIIFNLVREVPRTLGMEFFRGFVLSSSRRVKTSLIVTSLLFTFLSFTYTRYLSLLTSSYSSSLNFLMRSFIPVFLSNLLIGYLFILGGIKNSLMYSMFMRLYTYLMPVLPNVSSGVSAVVSVIQVFAFLAILSVVYFEDVAVGRASRTSKLMSLGFLAVVLAVLAFTLAGYRALVVVSGSMTPFLNVGDVAVINVRTDLSDVRVGDVIAFYLGRNVVIHRVVQVLNTSSGAYVTKGDANESPDSYRVSHKALLGRYVFKIPY